MRKIIFLSFAVLSFLAGWEIRSAVFKKTIVVNKNDKKVVEKPLEKYSFQNLSKVNVTPSEIKIADVIDKKEKYTSYIFTMEFDPSLSGKEQKKITGQINIPNSKEKLPLIVMFRGYVDQSIYQTGVGTKSAAEVFANNGFITIAPDFLGYAGSDKEAEDVLETRFQTYVTALSLLASLPTIEQFDNKTIFLWGHSNGGQIALIILEVTAENIPTTLWAPVSKPFPYSILYYMDESEDKGKLLRHEIAKFEEIYDVEAYSLDNFFEKINAPLLIHQGTADDAVPIDWTNELIAKLKKLEKEVTYLTYSGADHNMRPVWDTVVERDLEFFRNFLQEPSI